MPKDLLSDSRCTGEVHWGVARAEIKFILFTGSCYYETGGCGRIGGRKVKFK